MHMTYRVILSGLFVAALSLAACGSGSGTDSGKESSESKAQYKSFDDLPNCTSAREGEIAEILDDGEFYICKSKKWEEYEKTELKSYKTEDDMPNCSSKNENSLAFVEADSVVQACKNSRWETLGHPYANEDALPNCSKKRDGEKAYLMEEDEVQVCKDGVWSVTKNGNGKENESKSSGKEELNDSKVTESSDSQNPQSNNSDDIESSDSEVPTSGSSGDDNSSGSESEHSSASIAPGVTEGTFTDPRDGQKYKTTKIGNQVWFAQNLNYDTGDESSLCPLGKESYCEKYGRMYTLPYLGKCPQGWHVPYETEWDELIGYISLHNDGEGVGKSLKATTGWYEVGYTVKDESSGRSREAVATGDDLFRFSALPAGSCWKTNCYSDDDALFWSRDGLGYKIAFDEESVLRDGYYPDAAASIRCIESESGPIEIDPMPESEIIKGLEITSGNLTHSGSDVFADYDAFYACPEGWRLPTNNEMSLVVSSFFTDCEDYGFFTSDGFCKGTYHSELINGKLETTCIGAACSIDHPLSGHVRCVKE